MARRTTFAATNDGNSFCPPALGSSRKGRVDAAAARHTMNESIAFTASGSIVDCFVYTGDAEMIAWTVCGGPRVLMLHNTDGAA